MCGLPLEIAEKVRKATGPTLEHLLRFYHQFGEKDLTRVLIRGGVTPMFCMQINRALATFLEILRKKKMKERITSEDESNDVERVEPSEDANSIKVRVRRSPEASSSAPKPPKLNISNSIKQVMETGILVPEVTPDGARRRERKVFQKTFRTVDADHDGFVTLNELLTTINEDLSKNVHGGHIRRGSRRLTVEELAGLVRATGIKSGRLNTSEDSRRVFVLVEKLFQACDKFALSDSFFNGNALLVILRHVSYSIEKVCLEYFWKQVVQPQIMNNGRAGDASWAFKFCVQAIIFSDTAVSCANRMTELQELARKSKTQVDALRQWKKIQREMSKRPSLLNENDMAMDVDDEFSYELVVWLARSFAYNLLDEPRQFLDHVLEVALDRALRVPPSPRLRERRSGKEVYDQAMSMGVTETRADAGFVPDKDEDEDDDI